ncbi:MAG: GNAT family N-acetyltransferase, partial [Candidatus Nanopelagicales bacterium]
MEADSVLQLFDGQVRQNLGTTEPNVSIERAGDVVRCVSADGGWGGISWSHLDVTSVDEVIARQIDWFSERTPSWEWKHYSYDTPDDLADRLVAAGFVPGPAEALLVAEVGDLNVRPSTPPGVEVRRVVDAAGVAALVDVHNAVFGGEHSAVGRTLLAQLDANFDSAAAFI